MLATPNIGVVESNRNSGKRQAWRIVSEYGDHVATVYDEAEAELAVETYTERYGCQYEAVEVRIAGQAAW